MHRPSSSRRLLRWACALTCLAASSAQAAGMFLTPRGVRPLSRAGAFVAGADDGNALSYNPAGLAYAPSELLFDAGSCSCARLTSAASSPARSPSRASTGSPLELPSPTLAFVQRLESVRGLTVAGGVAVDYPLFQSWPSNVDGAPAPSDTPS